MSRVTVGVTVDNTSLENSSLAENDESEWSDVVTYAADDQVMVTGTTHKVYGSVQGSNLGNDPTTDDGTWWTEIGSTNRWKGFDGRVSDQAVGTARIGWTIRPGAGANAASLFNVTADTAEIQVEDDSDYIDLGTVTESSVTLTEDVYSGPCITELGAGMIETAANTNHYIYKPISVTAGRRYVMSAYVRIIGADRNVRFSVINASLNIVTNYDPVALTYGNSNGTDYAAGVQGVEHYGDWYRVWVAWTSIETAAANDARVWVLDSAENTVYLGDGTSGLSVYGWMVEEYEGAYSDFATWSSSGVTFSGATITDTPEVNPDARARQVTESAVLSQHGIDENIAVTEAATTFSVFVKQNTGTSRIALSVGLTPDAWAIFDLSTDSVVTSTGADGATITDWGDGWHLLSLTFSGLTAFPSHAVYMLQSGATTLAAYTGDGTTSIYVYGARSYETDGPPEYPTAPAKGITHRERLDVLRSSQVEDWYSYVFANFDIAGNVTFSQFADTTTERVQIGARLDGGTVGIGQALLGRNIAIGKTMALTEVGARDFSVKETDAFGRATLVQRGYSQEVDYRITIPTAGAQRAATIIDSLRATLVGWDAGSGTDSYGTTVFGHHDDYDIRLDVGESTVNLSVKGAV